MLNETKNTAMSSEQTRLPVPIFFILSETS